MERLKGKKQIEQLFTSGHSVGAFPLRLVYLECDSTNKIGVSVSKKHFKNAVDRNRIKRLLRVAVKGSLTEILEGLDFKCVVMVLYVGKEMPTTPGLKPQFESLIKRFNKKQSNEISS
tara:strand:+ start:943 stop:1296 length:354 start_codon:yes stop_codon:yes gene_type:complete